jgi:hypothetical protein
MERDAGKKLKISCGCFQQHFVPRKQDSIGCVGAALYAALVDDLSLPTFAELSRSLVKDVCPYYAEILERLTLGKESENGNYDYVPNSRGDELTLNKNAHSFAKAALHSELECALRISPEPRPHKPLQTSRTTHNELPGSVKHSTLKM